MHCPAARTRPACWIKGCGTYSGARACRCAWSGCQRNTADYFIAVDEDIDARRRAEDRVRRSEVLLSEAQRITHLGSFEWDAKRGPALVRGALSHLRACCGGFYPHLRGFYRTCPYHRTVNVCVQSQGCCVMTWPGRRAVGSCPAAYAARSSSTGNYAERGHGRSTCLTGHCPSNLLQSLHISCRPASGGRHRRFAIICIHARLWVSSSRRFATTVSPSSRPSRRVVAILSGCRRVEGQAGKPGTDHAEETDDTEKYRHSRHR